VNIESYFKARIDELRDLANRGDPWVFLCASSFIEYLAKMVFGKSTTATDYKIFLKKHFFRICPEYARFTYSSGKSDLADQMYHVLRCGIVHSFSLIADPRARTKNGRDRSILLAHRKNGATHLDHIVDAGQNPEIDAAVFTAEDFIEDISKVMENILEESRGGSTSARHLRNNIETWLDQYPPITGIIEIKPKPSSPNSQVVKGVTNLSSA
jgi:hypothetical protein